eukprot:COSAG02_NODE_5611_length_4190_cov_2.529455_3_plen_382_part_00
MPVQSNKKRIDGWYRRSRQRVCVCQRHTERPPATQLFFISVRLSIGSYCSLLPPAQELAEGLAINIHELSGDAALSARTQHSEAIDSDDYTSYRNELAQDIAQSVSDSGVWSDELSLAGPVDSSDQNITEYICSLFEFARRQLGQPDAEVSPGMRNSLESEIALSFVLEKTHEPNHQLFVGLERERERISAAEGATGVVTESQQIYNMALFDVCAEVVSAELAAASAVQRKRQRWFGTGQEQAPANALASFCLTQEMLTQRVLSKTKWQRKSATWLPFCCCRRCTMHTLKSEVSVFRIFVLQSAPRMCSHRASVPARVEVRLRFLVQVSMMGQGILDTGTKVAWSTQLCRNSSWLRVDGGLTAPRRKRSCSTTLPITFWTC